MKVLLIMIFISIQKKRKKSKQTCPWAPVSRRDLHTFSVTYFCGTHPSCLWPASIISSVQPPVFSLLIESLPKPTGMFKVAAMGINHLTPFPDPKDLASRPLLLWCVCREGRGGGVCQSAARSENQRGAAEFLELLRPRPLWLMPRLLKVNSLLVLSQNWSSRHKRKMTCIFSWINRWLCMCMCAQRVNVCVCVLALVSGPVGRWCSVGSTCHGAESLIDAWCFSGGQLQGPNVKTSFLTLWWDHMSQRCSESHFFKAKKSTWAAQKVKNATCIYFIFK